MTQDGRNQKRKIANEQSLKQSQSPKTSFKKSSINASNPLAPVIENRSKSATTLNEEESGSLIDTMHSDGDLEGSRPLLNGQ